MARPEWLDPKISMGNIITILMMIIGLVTAWQSLVGRVDAQERDINALKVAVAAYPIELEKSRTRMDTVTEKLLDRLQSIDLRLARMEERQARAEARP